MFDHPDYDGHERVVHAYDAASGLKAIVAIHSTALGPSFGGCRMYPYADEAAALRDVLRLSRAMTSKCAIVGLPYGGGKSVIIGDPRHDKTPDLLHAMGRLVDSLQGGYIVADDVGTTLDDMAVMRLETRFTAAATASARQPLPVTAHGVLSAIEAAARVVLCRDHRRFDGAAVESASLFTADSPSRAGVEPCRCLRGLTIAVQGLGNVGGPLCRLLHERGAGLIVADPDAARVTLAVECFGARDVPPDAIYAAKADIFAPCALGGILNEATIPRLEARVVCGGANNQLARREDGDRVAARGIVYVPDYLVGAGGVIDFAQEAVDDRPEVVLAAVGRIGSITEDVLVQAAASGETPLAICDGLVSQRLLRRC